MGDGIPAEETMPDGAFLQAPPPWFSAAYHLHFLPRVIGYRWHQYRHRERPQGFGAHVQLEIPIVMFVCLALAVFGLPPALEHGSVGGWLSALAGIGGLAALIGWSVIGEARWRREEQHRYGYAEFMPSVFFFFVLAGGSAGLIAGGIVTDHPAMGYAWALPGLLAGYGLAPFAARWIHALGFIKTWIIYLMMLGLILLPLEDLLVVMIYADKSGNPVWNGG